MFETAAAWGVLLATACLLAFLPRAATGRRAWLLALASGAALLGSGILTPSALALVVGLTAWILVGVRVTAPLAARRPMTATLLAFAPVLAVLVVSKTTTLLAAIGLSYFAVKAFTFVKDVHDGRVKDPSVGSVLAYFTFFPTFSLGPMHLYPEMEKALAEPRPVSGEGLVDAAYRITLGLIKIKLLAPLLAPLSLLSLVDGGPIHLHLGQLAIGAVVYSAVLWADFSGYSDLAVGTARLLGIAVPENFRLPYAARSIREFWQRWHITFSRVLTSYLFVPMTRALGRVPFFAARRRLTAAVATLATFAICGLWHGDAPHFVLWGLYHGVLLVAYDVLRRPGRKPGPASMVLTFLLVSAGWILFVLPLSRLIP